VLSLSEPTAPVSRRRRDPRPRFKADVSAQLDAIRGCPALQVADDDVARSVRDIINELDISSLEAQYSSLGRYGYHPRHVLAVLVYGSLRGMRESTKLAQCIKTDAAFRFVAGGHFVSAGTLRRFKSRNATFFRSAVTQTVRMAVERGLLKPDELAVDSVRLRAHASSKAVRQLSRSKKRLEDLAAVAVDTLTPDEKKKHEEKVAKHQDGVRRCEQAERTSVVLTNEAAGLMKFPDGASGPGHRVTVVAAGVKERLVVSVLIDASATDHGKLEPATLDARRVLTESGVDANAKVTITADAGYASGADLLFAASSREPVNILLSERTAAKEGEMPTSRYPGFSREKFTIDPELRATCPAGRLMKGPMVQAEGRVRWEGVGCDTCALKPQCTKGKQRTLTASPALDAARETMRSRMSEPGARAHYKKRMAIIEPVFSVLESVMGFRRLTTRHAANVVGEIMLNVLAYNIARLISRKPADRLFLIFVPEIDF
jgi:transposase